MAHLLPFVLQIAGLIIVLAVTAHIAFLALGSARRTLTERERNARSIELLDTQIEAARSLRARNEKEALSWQGFRKFEVAQKVDEGGDICSFYFKPHDRKPLPAFKPGQFLTFKFHVPGERMPTTRCYSLSSARHEDYYRISVKRVPAPPDRDDLPPGKGSGFLHDSINEHDLIDVKAPAGNFYLDVTKTTPIVLIGGGIGLTPMLSMLEAVAEHGFKREVWFFYGVRNSREHIMQPYLESLNAEHRKLTLRICYSAPLPGDVEKLDYHHGEIVSVELLKKLLPSSNFEFYICGPPPMMDSLVHGLKDWGVPDSAIHFEAFGPASVKTTTRKVSAAADGKDFKVNFARSGKQVSWSSQDGSLLDCAEANGVTINAGCRAGNCGTCLTAVRAGQVTYLNEPGEELEAGTCLVCVGVPSSDVTLDA